MNTRNTWQKQLIYDTLCKMSSHPTITELYDEVVQNDSSIGQATVYRNVSKLVDEGKICKVITKDGAFHYDANCMKHAHFLCTKCHRLYDLYDIDFSSIMKVMKKHPSFAALDAYVLVEGICNHCQ